MSSRNWAAADGRGVQGCDTRLHRFVALKFLPSDLARDPQSLARFRRDAPSPQSNINSYRISPDSRWVAYQSDESGQPEVYITSFPEGKGKWRISSSAGFWPVWRGDGKELFYADLHDDFFACKVTPKGSEVGIGTPEHLFHTPVPAIGIAFDVASDGKRLLGTTPRKKPRLRFNWSRTGSGN